MEYKYISICVVIFSIIASSVQFYHNKYIFRLQEAKTASEYLNSDVCSKAELRIKLGKYKNNCAEAEYELAINPSTRALYDLLEFYSFCGTKQHRCEAIVAWCKSNKYIILGFVLFFIYLLYQWFLYEWQMDRVSRYYSQQLLPIT